MSNVAHPSLAELKRVAAACDDEQIHQDYNSLFCPQTAGRLIQALELMDAAMLKFEKEFIQKYHPGENWFPQTLVIPEARAEVRKLVRFNDDEKES